MSLSNTTVKQTYVGNGIQTVFPITSQIIRDQDGSDEIKVYLRNETVSPPTQTLQVQGVNYTLTGGTPPTDVTMVVAPPVNHKLVVTRELTLQQLTDYLSTSQFPAETHELALDAIVAMVQQLKEELTRAPRVPITNAANLALPEPVASTVLMWNSLANAIEYKTAVQLLESIVGTVLLRANNLSDLSSVETALNNLGIDPFKSTASQAVSNNQPSPTNITNLLVQGSAYTSAVVFFEVRRRTDSDSKISNGQLHIYRQPHTGNWAFEMLGWTGQDIATPGGITFNLQQVGADAQMRYTSDNLLGANYVGTIKTSVKYFKV